MPYATTLGIKKQSCPSMSILVRCKAREMRFASYMAFVGGQWGRQTNWVGHRGLTELLACWIRATLSQCYWQLDCVEAPRRQEGVSGCCSLIGHISSQQQPDEWPLYPSSPLHSLGWIATFFPDKTIFPSIFLTPAFTCTSNPFKWVGLDLLRESPTRGT